MLEGTTAMADLKYPAVKKSLWVINLLCQGLQESYPSLTPKYTEEVFDALQRGEKPTNIIGMFIEKSLKEAQEAHDEHYKGRV